MLIKNISGAKLARKFLLPLAVTTMIAAPVAVLAQDLSYKSAKSAGIIGEKPDGYLEVVSNGNAEARKLVNSVNIKRKAKYTELAAQKGVTVQDIAFTTGCNLIAQTSPGEKYLAPNGQWKTRDGSPPQRDARCP